MESLKRFQTGHHTSLVLSRDQPRADYSRFTPEFIPRYPESNGLVRFKVSNKLFIGKKQPTSGMFLPFINKIGLITNHFLGIWKCSYHDLFCTLIATVYKRLRSRFYEKSGNNRKLRYSDLDLYKVAFLYVSSNDQQWFLRTYGLMKTNPKALKNHLYYKISQMDNNIRFLYAQMQNCISWVQSRCRQGKRVKSIPSSWSTKYPELLEFKMIRNKKLQEIFTSWGKEFSSKGVSLNRETRASLEKVVVFHGTSTR